MNGVNGQHPDRVGQACLGLERALDRLERVLEARAGRTAETPDAPGADTDNAASGALDALKRENAHLRAANENAAGRLGAAIGRLEKFLAE